MMEGNRANPVRLQRRDRAGCGEEGDGYEERSLAYQRFRRELLGAELLRLRSEGRISDEVRRRVERDLEDARLEI
jgi:hypothetical protein